jgi:hypothetical protein
LENCPPNVYLPPSLKWQAPSLFSIEMGSHKLSCLGWPAIAILPISFSVISCDDRCMPLWLATCWDGSHQICPSWPQNVILLISSFHIDVSNHQHPAQKS